MTTPRVLAATYQQFRVWCEQEGCSPHSAVYVHSVDQLRGLRPEDVVVLPGWDDKFAGGRHAIVNGQIRSELEMLKAVHQ